VVQSGATLVLTGPGFDTTVLGGTPDWSLLSTVNESGTFVFAPVPAIVNQGLISFGTDHGRDESWLTAGTAVGALDASAVGTGHKLTVYGARNVPVGSNNALYINSLVGLDPATVQSRLDSNITLYYNASNSFPNLGKQDYQLASGYWLRALNIPEPGTAILLMAAVAGAALRPRRDV